MKSNVLTNETVLDKYDKAHQALVEHMDSALYEIWEYSKAGNTAAHDFMCGELRNRIVQFELDFSNTDILQSNRRATYGIYKTIMTKVVPFLNGLRNECVAQ